MFQKLIQKIDANLNRSLLLVAIVGLVVRILFVLVTQNIGGVTSMDGGTYHSIALNLLKGVGFSEDGANPSIFVAPLYPMFLALIYLIFGVKPIVVEIFQSFLGVGIAYLAFLIARRFFTMPLLYYIFNRDLFSRTVCPLHIFIHRVAVYIFIYVNALAGN